MINDFGSMLDLHIFDMKIRILYVNFIREKIFKFKDCIIDFIFFTVHFLFIRTLNIPRCIRRIVLRSAILEASSCKMQ